MWSLIPLLLRSQIKSCSSLGRRKKPARNVKGKVTIAHSATSQLMSLLFIGKNGDRSRTETRSTSHEMLIAHVVKALDLHNTILGIMLIQSKEDQEDKFKSKEAMEMELYKSDFKLQPLARQEQHRASSRSKEVRSSIPSK